MLSSLRRFANIIYILLCSILLIQNVKAQSISQIKDIDSLYMLLPNVKSDSVKLLAYNQLALLQTNIDSIEKYNQLAYYLCIKLGDSTNLGMICQRLGWCKNITGRYLEGGQFYRQARDVYSKTGNVRGNAAAISGYGDSFLGIGQFETGIKLKLRALQIFEANNDISQSAVIYRAMGQASSEYQQYKMAMYYLDKALQYDQQINNTRSIGRDYHYLGRIINEYTKNNEFASKQIAKEYLITALDYHEKTSDYIFKIHSCVILSMIYNDLIICTSNRNFADSSLYYYNLGRETIKEINYSMLDADYNIAHTEHLVLNNNKTEALKVLNEYNSNNTISNSTRQNLYHAYDFYFHYYNDYKGLLNYIGQVEHHRKKIYISEFETKITKINKMSEFEQTVTQLDIDTQIRNSEFENSREWHDKFLGFIITILILFLIVIAALIIVLIHDKRQNIKLAEQNEEIESANEELRVLMTEASEQSAMIQRQTIEMKRQRNKLASYNLRIVLNLEIGSRFQTSLLPSEQTMKNIFDKIFILWKPLEEVGGDFYWGTEINGKKIAVVADCTGHGIPGAFLSMLGISLLNGIVMRMNTETMNAAEILIQLRDRMVESLMRGSVSDEDIHDGMDVSVCVFDQEKSTVSYSGAYRPLWIISNNNLVEYKADKIPVAIDKDKLQPFNNQDIKLNKGDCLYMFSDGITDQYGKLENGKVSKFKPKRFRELLTEISNYEPSRQGEEIELKLKNWRGMEEQTDDVTVLGIVV